jgi:hypothetical protein
MIKFEKSQIASILSMPCFFTTGFKKLEWRCKKYCALALVVIFSCNKKGSDESSRSISDVLFLNDTVIVCAKRNSEIVMSENGGTTWASISKCYVDQLTIDDKGTIWGIKSWIGIHEPSFSELYYSKNRGKSWVKNTFDTKVFFPVKIFSEPHQKLSVLSFSDKVYELRGNNIKGDWAEIGSVDTNRMNQVSGLHNEREFKKMNSRFDLSDWSICLDVLENNDTVYMAGEGIDRKAYFSMFPNKNQQFKYKMDGTQATGIKKDLSNRIWVFGDAGLFLQSGKILLKKM